MPNYIIKGLCLSPVPVCVVCDTKIPNSSKFKSINCKECGFKICSKNCLEVIKVAHAHDDECLVLTDLVRNHPDKKFVDYSLLLPLRILLLKQKKPEKFGKIMDLQSHREDVVYFH